jgi:hypothetical protein
MKLFVILALSATLTGCAAYRAQNQQRKMEAALSPYAGRSIADYVVQRGAPQSSVALNETTRMFTWEMYGSSAGVIVPINGMLISRPPQTLSCSVNMIAKTTKKNPTLSDWIISGWRWSGAC